MRNDEGRRHSAPATSLNHPATTIPTAVVGPTRLQQALSCWARALELARDGDEHVWATFLSCVTIGVAREYGRLPDHDLAA